MSFDCLWYKWRSFGRLFAPLGFSRSVGVQRFHAAHLALWYLRSLSSAARVWELELRKHGFKKTTFALKRWLVTSQSPIGSKLYTLTTLFTLICYFYNLKIGVTGNLLCSDLSLIMWPLVIALPRLFSAPDAEVTAVSGALRRAIGSNPRASWHKRGISTSATWEIQ